MNDVKIYPSKLNGEVVIPPSKSIAHRAIICAALSKGISIIKNIDLSKDIIATIEAMKTIGVVIEITYDKRSYKTLKIDGKNTFNLNKNNITIDCSESGSTLRFLMPIVLHYKGEAKFIGEGNLNYRPQEPYIDIFNDKKVEFNIEDEGVGKKTYLPMNIKGKKINGNFFIDGNISSQFISGLLFSLPLMEESSKIILKTPLESKGYVDLTLKVLKEFGIHIENNNYREFYIKGKQRYQPKNYTVESDYSQGAFFLVANEFDSAIKINGLKEESLQGDKAIIDIIRFIRDISTPSSKSEDIGKQDICYMDKSNTLIIDAKNIPDIIPIITVLCSFIKIKTKIINAQRLRIKESDRLKAVATTLNSIGANIKELEDGLLITNVKELKGGEVYGFNDHRIVMSLAIASLKCKTHLTIKGYEAISKSYPGFFKDFKSLGGNIEYK